MKLTTVGNYPDLATAELAASLLEAAGIDSLIPDENFAGMSWQMGSAIQGVRLQVGAADANAARSVLEAHEALEVEPDEDQLEIAETGVSARCPACGSDRLGEARWRNRLKAIAIVVPIALLAWPILAAMNSRTQCLACGHGWR